MTDKNDLPSLTSEQQKAVLDTKEVLAAKEDVLKQLGQIEAFEFMSKLATVATIKKLKVLKDTKAYKGLTYIADDGTLATVASWNECCTHKLPWSTRTVDEKLQSLEVLGEEYFEAASNVGLSTKDMRKLRALPTEERLQVMQDEAIESGDKDAIREVIDELHHKHKQESRDTKNELADAKADLTAVRQLNSDQAKREEELMLKLEKAKYTPENWRQKTTDTIDQVMLAASQALIAHDKLVQLQTLIYTESTNGENSQEAMEYVTSVFLNSAEKVAQSFALLLGDAAEELPWQNARKPTEEILIALADQACEQILDTDQ